MTLATGVAGVGVAAGAALAAAGRGHAVRESARAWAIAYTAGVLVYLTGLELPWPQPDISVIVTSDGSPGLSDGQAIALVLTSIAVSLLLGAALDGTGRAEPGRRSSGAAASVAAWAMSMLSLPILIVLGIYATSIAGNVIRFAGEVPAHLVALVCSGGFIGAVLDGTAEALSRHVTPSPPRY